MRSNSARHGRCFWRDLGYAIGALSAGFIADLFALSWAIGAVAALTYVSGAIVAAVMREQPDEPPVLLLPDVTSSRAPMAGSA